MSPLGEAVHSGDRIRAEALERRATDLERELDRLQDEASRFTAAAREELARERATLEPTATVVSHPPDPGRR
jgi:F0F1-type ATP synthase membrane subunit b/b'